MSKLHKGLRTLRAGSRVLFTKGPVTFTKMTAAKLRATQLKRGRAEIAEEFGYVNNPVFQITTKDIADSRKATDRARPEKIRTANWFIPYFEHAAYGGAYTMLRFVNYFAEKGVENRVIIYDRPATDKAHFHDMMVKTFPQLADARLFMLNGEAARIAELPESDIAFCTSWQSAYFLLKFNKTRRKYYFAMDYEPLFYPAGAIYALAESTYRFPFRGLINTPGLLMALNKRHGLEGISYVPAVDRHIYHANTEEAVTRHKPIRIFFYTRPNNLRNAFTLMVLIMKQLLREHGKEIEIVTAGADWNEAQYGLKGKITNMGLLHSLEAVADLYRTCDIGIIYMLSKHPSYQPFEYMACGMATVTNNNEDNLWLFQHEKNCLVAEPSPTAMAEQITRLVKDEDLRQKIVKNGFKLIENEWDWQTETIWNDIKNN